MGGHARAPSIHRALARVERQIPSLLAPFQFAGRELALTGSTYDLRLDLPVERTHL
jgi:hypothetical protein